jgi:putative heme transporter
MDRVRATVEEPERGLEQEMDAMEGASFGGRLTPRTIAFIVLGIIAAILGLYVLLPKVVGVSDAFKRIGDAKWYWIIVAVGFEIVSFIAYGLAFRAVVASGPDSGIPDGRIDFRASYQIRMAAFAGSTFFSAAGAGGLAIMYWALRRAGMEARRTACRLVALTVLLYSFYALSLIVFGVLLRTGVVPGANPTGGTTVPALVAGLVIVIAGLIALIPSDLERRIGLLQKRKGRWARVGRRAAAIPGTVATGVRTAIDRLRDARTGWLAVSGGLLYWAGNIGVLWAAFHAFGVHVPLAVVVQAFFVGMAANVIPSPAAGAGPVDAGMIGAFLLFDIPKESVFPAILTYRLIAFWMPAVPGVPAYFALRRTVAKWEREDSKASSRYTSESKVLEAT